MKILRSELEKSSVEWSVLKITFMNHRQIGGISISEIMKAVTI